MEATCLSLSLLGFECTMAIQICGRPQQDTLEFRHILSPGFIADRHPNFSHILESFFIHISHTSPRRNLFQFCIKRHEAQGGCFQSTKLKSCSTLENNSVWKPKPNVNSLPVCKLNFYVTQAQSYISYVSYVKWMCWNCSVTHLGVLCGVT